MKYFTTLICSLLFTLALPAQQKIERLIIVTTDGLRWQEVFSGMDSGIAVKKNFNQGDSVALFKKYWHPDAAVRRKTLLPFLWSTVATNGQIYGSRLHGNKFNTANKYWFSYPGYNEIFTGYPDTLVNANNLPDNKHVTVLEYLHQQKAYRGSIAAFGAWKAFNQILNERRSGFPVVAAFDTVAGKGLTASQILVNKMLLQSYKPWHEDECLDIFTHTAAIEYLKTSKPKLLYIAYGETDEWAHAGQYRDYLNAAHQVDAWLAELWQAVQSSPDYKDKTALLITVDHGRGRNDEWTSHGSEIAGADEMWFAVLAPGLPAKGEVQKSGQWYQQQLAQTIANLLGQNYKAAHPVAPSLIDELRR